MGNKRAVPYFRVANLDKFQHYKDRDPPWIKLHAAVLEKYEFGCLQDASKAHLMQIWLLASRTGNRMPYDPRWIGNRINATGKVDLDELQAAGFIHLFPDASNPLATRLHVAAPEGETEGETEGEGEHHLRGAGKPASTPAPFILLPLAKNGDEAEIHAHQLDEWREAYPGVAIEQELRHMRQWCLNNPTKRKTPRGIGKFITTWLAKEQNRGGGNGRGPPTPKRSAVDDMAASLGMEIRK